MRITMITKENTGYFAPLLQGSGIGLTDIAIRYAVLDDNRKVAGIAVAKTEIPLMDIRYFDIYKKYRGKGYGRFLLEGMLNTGISAGLRDVRATYPEENSVSAFFSRMDFDLFPGETQYAFSFNVLQQSEKYQKYLNGQPAKQIQMMDSLDVMGKRVAREAFQQYGLSWNSCYDDDLSSVVIKDGELYSTMLCRWTLGGADILFMFSRLPNPAIMLQHFRALDCKILKNLRQSVKNTAAGNEFTLRFSAQNDTTVQLVKDFLGGEGKLEEHTTMIYAVRPG